MELPFAPVLIAEGSLMVGTPQMIISSRKGSRKSSSPPLPSAALRKSRKAAAPPINTASLITGDQRGKKRNSKKRNVHGTHMKPVGLVKQMTKRKRKIE